MFDSIQTPALILDRATLQRNLDVMQARMSDRGVTLRPHLKTAKSAKVAALAREGGAVGITVSTLAEAEYFHTHGFSDITYAVGMAPGKLDRAAMLIGNSADLRIITDNIDAARAIAAHAAAGDVIFKVLIEIDTGDGRAGLLPESDELIEIGELLDGTANVDLLGVLTHAGQSYACHTPEAIRTVADIERDGIVRAAERLRDRGMPCPVVSGGSTPTAVHAGDLTGVTEMRPGVFVFNDLKQLSGGACDRNDLALSVLASVIGHNRHKGHLLLDAGALAISKDISAVADRPEVGYGEVCDPSSMAPHEGLYVTAVSQEHGIVPVADEAVFDRLAIGAKVRILPNHACITAAAYDCYHVLENGAVTEEWDRINGW